MEDIRIVRKQHCLEIISNHLDVIVKQVRAHPRSNPKKSTERVLCGLLNLLNGWNLIPNDQEDFIISPIDFSDKKECIALHVTFHANTEDIIRTLRIFSHIHLDSCYHSFFVLFISDQSFPFNTAVLPRFNWFSPENNILDLPSIKTRIQNETDLELLEKVSVYLDSQVRYFLPSSNHPLYLLPPPPRHSESFLLGSRNHELEQLIHLMDQKNPLFLWGAAGIGKTELAIQLANQLPSPRGTYFLAFKQPKDATDASMFETILQADFDGHIFECTSEREIAFQERLAFLREEYYDTTLIIDGFDCPGRTIADLTGDQSYRDLIALCQHGLHLVITTRSMAPRNGLEVGPLSSDILLKQLRDSYPDTSTTDDHLLELLHAVENNTLIVNLMSQILYTGNGDITPWMLMETFLKGDSNLYNFPPVVTDQNRKCKTDTFVNHLCNMLDLSSIGNDAIHVLMCATFLSVKGMDDQLFFNALPSKYHYILPYLFDGQWLHLNKKTVSIPSLVRHVCLNKPTRIFECANSFLDNLWKSFNLYNSDKSLIEEIAICFSNAADRRIEDNGLNSMRAGRFWDFTGNQTQAIKYYIHSLLIMEKGLPPNHLDLVVAYIDAAKYLTQQHMYQRSLEYSLRVLEILNAILPSDHLDLANAHHFAAINLSCFFHGRYQEALDHILTAISIREYELPKNHPDIAISYYLLGQLFIHLDDYPVALSYQKKSQSLFEEAIPFNQAYLSDVSASIDEINKKIAGWQNRLETLRSKIAAPSEQLLSDPCEFTNTYINAAECCLNLDDYEAALEYYQKALEISKQIPKKDQYRARFFSNIFSKVKIKKDNHQKALAITQQS